MIKFLLGGSPCTNWSIAQNTKNRETTASGEGWELFLNYVIAKERFKPDFFLYENNKSAANPIKEQIGVELGVPLQYINSALVSAQKRERFYCHNFGDVPQPEDRGIILQDILETGAIADAEKFECLRATYYKSGKRNFEKKITDRMGYQGVPVRLGNFPNQKGETKGSQAMRIYSHLGKSVNLTANGGGAGAKTGLYAIPSDLANGHKPVYRVKGGQIEINDRLHPINLPDGFYIIRKLSVTEAARLQTMPDDYCRVVSDTQAYKGLGNGWTAEVIIHLLAHALRGVPKNEEIVVLSMYDGIGTGRYCFDKLGYHNITYYAYEIDRPAITVAMSNYSDIKQCGDAYLVRGAGWNIKGAIA